MSSSVVSAAAELAEVPVICGPTAAGKSAIAMWLAERHDVVIISADSRQVYRGLDIGTAKPATGHRSQVTHYGVDVVDPTERFSAAAWAEMATSAITDAVSAGRAPLIVGGTGFYISTLFKPLWQEPQLAPAARAAVQAGLAELSTEELRRWCRTLDPPRAELGRTQLVRAVEIALLTGERLSDQHKSGARQARFSARYIVLDPGMTLATRIATRASAMFASGWVDEVKGLMKTVPDTAPAWNATGYRLVRQMVTGEITEKAALERIAIETRQFAKRQRTWFRNQLDEAHVTRLAPNGPGWEATVERWFIGSLVTGHRSRSS